jgi:hypothetical protein
MRRIGLANAEMRARMAIRPPARFTTMTMSVVAMAPPSFGSGCEGDGHQNDSRKREKCRNQFFHRWFSRNE